MMSLAGNANQVNQISRVEIDDNWLQSDQGWITGVVRTRDGNGVPGRLVFGMNGAPPLFSPGGLVIDVYAPAPGTIAAGASTAIGAQDSVFNDGVGGSFTGCYGFLVTREGNAPAPIEKWFPGEHWFPDGQNGGGANGESSSGLGGGF
jgi:hypothetical protein